MSEPCSPRPDAPGRARRGTRRWKPISFAGTADHGGTVTILRCADGGYFTGVARRTANDRPGEHPRALFDSPLTATRRPVTLLHAEHHERIADAFAAGARIRRWSRANKEAYMRGYFPKRAAPAKTWTRVAARARADRAARCVITY
jgi:putative endonuclease